MKSDPPPAAPDPMATARAQSGMNRETAITQYGLAATNQVTPEGSLSFRQIGTWPDGTPRYEATTALSPDQQGLYDTGVKTQQNIGNIGLAQSQKIGNLLNQPVNLNTAAEDKLVGLGRKRLDPQFTQAKSALESDLFNRGVRPGTEQYDRAMQQFAQQQNDAYNQLYLTGRGQGVQEALTERNQPINEITALLSGGQVSQPNFTGTPSPGVAPTDYIGAVNAKQASDMEAWKAQQQQSMGLMSGLFGIGKTIAGPLGGWAFSDRRVKDDVRKVGELDSGLPLYSFRYKGGGMMQLGLMAQDVEKVMPSAVAETPEGVKAVNYSAIAEAA